MTQRAAFSMNPPADVSGRARLPWGVIALGLLCLLLAIAAVIIRAVTIGSDGASTEGRAYAYQADGVEVFPYLGSTGLLQSGDLVVAVDGVPMTEWARRLYQSAPLRASWPPGRDVTYQIERNGQPLTLHIRLQRLPVWSVIQARWGFLLFVFISELLATWLIFRRPRVPAARLFFLWTMLGAQMYVWSFPIQIGDIVTGYGFWLGRILVAGMGIFFYPALVHFTLLYPKPAPVLRRHRWLLSALYAGSVLIYFTVIGWLYATAPSILAALGASGHAVSSIAFVYLLLADVIVILQYRDSRPGAERQRAQWALFGGLVAVLAGLVLGVVMPMLVGHTLIDFNLYGLILLAFPVSMTIAMWRYHLFDIEVIIRKTLLYSVVASILAVVYIAAIILLESILGQFTGQNSRPAVALATAGIMLLFIPVRSRVQRFLDRAFYRTSYDAEELVTRFGLICREETDLSRLLAALEEVIHTSLQPAQVSVWLAPHSADAGQQPDHPPTPPGPGQLTTSDPVIDSAHHA